MVHHLAFKEKVPRFDWAPPGVGHHARGTRHSGPSPGRGPRSKDHLRPNAEALSSHETVSRVPDARLMASNFCTGPSRPTGDRLGLAAAGWPRQVHHKRRGWTASKG